MEWLLVPLAYFFGSLATAVLVSRVFGLPDPREEGSKNPGATNVLRLGGKKAAFITLLGDTVKGLFPVLLAKALGTGDVVVGMVGLSALVGHIFPIFFNFRGGKGVATALGVLSGFSWGVGLSVLATWCLSAAVWRISSLSALIASVLAPLYTLWITHSSSLTGTAVLIAVLLWMRHWSNIQRLLKGEETRIGQKD